MIQPFVMGATLSLNPLVVLVVTIGAGALFGMVGQGSRRRRRSPAERADISPQRDDASAAP